MGHVISFKRKYICFSTRGLYCNFQIRSQVKILDTEFKIEEKNNKRRLVFHHSQSFYDLSGKWTALIEVVRNIFITSLFDNFSLLSSNDVCSLLFSFFTLWFTWCYWRLSLFTVTVFLLFLSKDGFMIMCFLWVCSKFFVASILQHYFNS